MVLATQNPIESEGTYPLPEAQLDRFMLKAVVDYPTRQEERQILERFETGASPHEVRQVVSIEQLMAARAAVQQVHLNDALRDYIVHLDPGLAQSQGLPHGLAHAADLLRRFARAPPSTWRRPRKPTPSSTAAAT